MSEGGVSLTKRVLTSLVTIALLATLLYGAGGARAHAGAWIDSSYVTTAPTIDGTLGPGEWANATAIDLGAIPGNGVPAFLLVQNNGTSLFLAYDAVGDVTNDAQDMASVAFDTLHDGVATGTEDQFWWGSGAPNGQAHITYDGFGWLIEDSPFDTGLPNHADLAAAYGFGPSDLSATDHQVYELEVPLNLTGGGPGQVIGFLGGSFPSPGLLDISAFAYDTWPSYYLGPPPHDQYGDLRLGQPAQVVDLDLNPPSQSQRAPPGSVLLYAITAVNRGAGTDTFDLTELSPWPVTFLDEFGMMPLPDTDGDFVPDTGPIAGGASMTFTARVDVPFTTGCGESLIIGTSSNDLGVFDTSLLHSCVPDAFLDPPHSDVGIDTDVPPNGRFDVLQIGVGTWVNLDGFYVVAVALLDATQTTLITTGSAGGFYLAGYNVISAGLAGGDIFRSGIDGPYVAVIQLFDASFTLIDQGTHTTAAYNATDFDPPAALFSPPHADSGLDTDVPPDGLYDFLLVNASVTVNRAGTFRVDGVLLDDGLNFVTFTSAIATLGTGPGMISLEYLGRDIFSAGADGPYTVLMTLTGALGFLDQNVYVTGAYTFDEFEEPPAFFSPPHSDQGVDLTVPPDGRFEYLEIDASVQVLEAGRYSVRIDLYDASGFFLIASATKSAILGPGVQPVPVRLNGIEIANSGFNGPYLAVLYLTDEFGPLGQDLYMTNPYTTLDFAPAGARLAPPYSDRLEDVDGDGLADWLAVDVGVDVTIPGTYALTGAIVDPIGRVVGAAPACGPLAGGLQTCTLQFDGHEIAGLGASGPFVVDFRLFDEHGRFLGRDFHNTAPYANAEFEPMDTTVPTATAGAVSYWVNRLPLSIPWTASDPAPTDGLASITLLYRRSTDNATWGPWQTYVTLPVSGATANGAIPFIFDAGIGFYEFQVIATDLAGNAEPFGPAEAGAMFRPLASLSLTPATLNVPAGQQRTLQVRVLGPDGQLATLQTPLIVTLLSQSLTGEFRTVGTGNVVTGITIPAGQSSGSVDYYDTASGTWGLLASSGPTTDGTAEAVVAAGPVASVTISPTTAALQVAGTLPFAATARDQFGNPMSGVTFSWSADPAVGTISGGGVLTAATRVASGNVTVSVTGNPAIRATATVTLVPGPATVVGVVPGSATLEVGSVEAFAAVALDAYGNLVTTALTWSADSAIGTITSGGVLTAATTVGSGLVTAAVTSNPAVRGTASVTLVPGPPATVTIAPPTTVTLAVDATHAFSAAVRDQYGNAIANPPLTWSVTGGIGTVDAAGLFTAGHVDGTGTVVASSGTAQASATVTVTPGSPAQIVVDPPDAIVTVGTSSQGFTAQVYDRYGNLITGQTVTWTTVGAIGTVDASGVLTAAQTVSAGYVVATVGGMAVTAAVTLVHGPASAIQLAPTAATVRYGTTVGLRALVVDQYGNPIPEATVAWTVSGPGTLSPSSGAATTLNVTQEGTVTVTATSGTVTATATFTVLGPTVIPPPEPSNAPLIGVGGLIAGLAVGAMIGWAIRGRRRQSTKEPEEKDEEDEEEDEET